MSNKYNSDYYEALVDAVSNNLNNKLLSPFKLIILNGLVNNRPESLQLLDKGTIKDKTAKKVGKLALNFLTRNQLDSKNLSSPVFQNLSVLPNHKISSLGHVRKLRAVFKRSAYSRKNILEMDSEIEKFLTVLSNIHFESDYINETRKWIWSLLNKLGYWEVKLKLPRPSASVPQKFIVGTGLKYRNRLISDFLHGEGESVLRWIHGAERAYFEDYFYHKFEFNSVSGVITEAPKIWEKRLQLDKKNLRVYELDGYDRVPRNFNRDKALVIGSCLISENLRQPFGFKRSNDEILAVHRDLIAKAQQDFGYVAFKPHPKGMFKEKMLNDVPKDVPIEPMTSIEQVIPTYGAFYFEYCGSAWLEVVLKKADDQVVIASNNSFRKIHSEMLQEIPPNVFFV